MNRLDIPTFTPAARTLLVPTDAADNTRWGALRILVRAFVGDHPHALYRLLAAALVLRSAVVLIGGNSQVSDALVYDALARGLASGEGYVWLGHPSAWWPVGYPAVLSLAYAAVAPMPLVGQLLNVLLGTITVGLVYALAKKISPGIASLAGWGMALFPSHVIATTLLTTETLCTTLWVLAVWLLWPPIAPRRAAVGGLACAALATVRPSLLLFPLVWYGLVWVGFQRRRLLAPLAASLIVMLAALTPWAVRNTRVLDGFALISTNGGFNLWMGNNPRATGTYYLTDGRHSFLAARRDPDVPWDREVEQDRIFRAKSWNFVRSHPVQTVRLAAVKVSNLWVNDNDAVSWWLEGLTVHPSLRRLLYVSVHSFALLAYAVVMCVAAYGATTRIRQNPRLSLLLVPAVFVTCLHAVFHGDPRFHVPAMPFLIVLAAVACESELRQRSRQRSEQRARICSHPDALPGHTAADTPELPCEARVGIRACVAFLKATGADRDVGVRTCGSAGELSNSHGIRSVVAG